MKKFLVFLIVLGLIAFGACRRGSEEIAGVASTSWLDQPQKRDTSAKTYPTLRVKSSNEIVIGYMHQTLDSETIKRVTRQVQIEAYHRKWELVEAIYDGSNRASIRDSFMSLINQDVDAIVLYNTDPQSYADLIIEARNKGVGVYNIDSELTEGVVANSCVPNGVAAATLAYMLGERFQWQANVAFVTIPAFQVHMERSEVPIAIFKQYAGMNVIGYETVAIELGFSQQAYELSARLIEKFGSDLDIIFGSWDGVGSAAAEAAAAVGNSRVIAVGIDGGSEAWSHIRKNGTFQASYGQASEMYAHKIMELVEQLQIKAMKPGDPGCLISTFGETMYSNGVIVTPDNVPAPGQTIHAVQEYYDPTDTDAWYFWDDSNGIYMVE
jgi:ABC-type sugar transport system substrate-binding protein